jgi:hypothetical protein
LKKKKHPTAIPATTTKIAIVNKAICQAGGFGGPFENMAVRAEPVSN